MSPLDVNPAAERSLDDAPAPVLLLGALGAMGLSLSLELSGRDRASRFVAMWPTPLLVAGMYNKLVKTLGTR